MSVLISNLIGVKHDLDKADMMIAKSYVDEAIQRIEALESLVRQLKIHADMGSCSRCQQAHRNAE